MKREIKFRVWDKFEKKMFDSNILCLQPWNVYEGMNKRNDENWIYNQFTGVLDRNNIEIYEGDIMRVLDRDWISGDYSKQSVEDYKKSISTITEVTFEMGSFWLKNYGELCKEYGRDVFEVIGNIYQNPNLTPQETK